MSDDKEMDNFGILHKNANINPAGYDSQESTIAYIECVLILKQF